MATVNIVPIHFECSHTADDGVESKWAGVIKSTITYGSHYEIRVSHSESQNEGLTVIVGPYTDGNFMWIERYSSGLKLADPLNLKHNKEQVLAITGEGRMSLVEGITVVTAFKALAEGGYFNQPRSKGDVQTRVDGAKIARLRQHNFMSQQQLAEGICSASMLSQIEHNKANASVRILENIAHRLGVCLEDLAPDQYDGSSE